MPKRAAIHAVSRYNDGDEAARHQRGPERDTAAEHCRTTRNIGSDGMTYQKVASTCEAIRALSPVSRYSQMTAMTEIRGSDATSAPKCGTSLCNFRDKRGQEPGQWRFYRNVDLASSPLI
jgi:hypothetical protein